ncbi:bifunctional 2-keto-4-hydroxyglutarate aldolase/2-keto-3-deoxy-6-phosphogluconate aldolase [Candidatus Bipolaricaulota bacterium]|nr:bifunctional 2-keto-4-hydroxyglutarate aldolase/2-keto-3-deoxy-6-phosphogluconate aldolase [Candidatus Bipolaricaulota bacterium]
MSNDTEKQENLQTMIESGVVAVIRTESSERLLKVARAIKKGGVNCIEVAMTTPNALQVIKDVTAEVEGVLIGAGTVLDAETARSAILAGAEYLVSPTLNYDMVKMVKRYGKIVAPGTFTPTEIMDAWEAGADIVKVFPASRLGPKFISDVKSPLPQVSLMPTGGVSAENASDFIRAGADVVCVGSALIDKQALERNNFNILTENAKKLVESVNKGKEERLA